MVRAAAWIQTNGWAAPPQGVALFVRYRPMFFRFGYRCWGWCPCTERPCPWTCILYRVLLSLLPREVDRRLLEKLAMWHVTTKFGTNDISLLAHAPLTEYSAPLSRVFHAEVFNPAWILGLQQVGLRRCISTRYSIWKTPSATNSCLSVETYNFLRTHFRFHLCWIPTFPCVYRWLFSNSIILFCCYKL